MRTWRSLFAAVVLFLAAASASQAGLIVGVTDTASSYYLGSGSQAPAVALVNKSGFQGVPPNYTDYDSDGAPEHGTEWRNKMWMSATDTLISDQWVEFALPDHAGLDFMRVWDYNQASDTTAEPDKWKRGVKNAIVEWRPDVQSSWVTLNGGASYTFNPGTGLIDYDNVTTVDFTGQLARFVRIRIQSNWNDNSGGGYVGMSEVDFFEVPEPATLTVLALGGLALLRRKNRR